MIWTLRPVPVSTTESIAGIFCGRHPPDTRSRARAGQKSRPPGWRQPASHTRSHAFL